MSDCNPTYIKALFCNKNLTEKKSKTENKPQNKMTKRELLTWVSRNKYR